jgi:FKBP-type peptidyl-prolyl cis-trans isomerase 2
MDTAKSGDKVRVHYTGTLDDGTVFDSTRQRGPMEFKIGEGRLVPGFEEAVIGMKPGEVKKVHLEPAKAFGRPNRQARAEMAIDDLPENIKPYEGQRLSWIQPNGLPAQATVLKVREKNILLDTNHPLAGKPVNFEIELIGILQS